MSWANELRELLSLIFPSLIRLSSEGRKRRLDVRTKLVPLKELVQSVGWGAWPAGTHEGWAPTLGETLKLRAEVVRELDLDRGTAGRRWCRDVETCLDVGWKLVHHCYGMSIGMFKKRGDWTLEEHDRLRAAFLTAYKKVT